MKSTTGKIYRVLLILLLAFSAGCSKDNSITGSDTDGSYTVSGKVVYESGTGISEVYVNISGKTDNIARDENINFSVPTDQKGTYTLVNIKNGTYRITPFKSGITFTPSYRSIKVSGANVSVNAFTVNQIQSGNDVDIDTKNKISGRVVDQSGNGIPEISIGLAGNDLTKRTETDTFGYFLFNEIPNGTYTIAPGKEGFNFQPAYTVVTVKGHDETVESFIVSEEDGEDMGFAGTHSYYPMSRFASWTKKKTITDIKNGYSDSYEYTLHVTGTKNINDKKYWKLVNDDDEFDSYIRIMNEIVYKMSGQTGENNPLNDELPFLRLNLAPGTQYDIMSYSSSELGASFTLTWYGTYHGTKEVSVIAGTFEDCKKYEIIYDAVAVGGGAYQREITTFFLWLAPDVGIVKSTETRENEEKITWKSEEELIGYSIP